MLQWFDFTPNNKLLSYSIDVVSTISYFVQYCLVGGELRQQHRNSLPTVINPLHNSALVIRVSY